MQTVSVINLVLTCGRLVKMDEIIKNYLRDNKIKLWLPPFTDDAMEPQDLPASLLQNVSNIAGCSTDVVSSILCRIRLHAIHRFVANNKFKDTGVATLYLCMPSVEDTCAPDSQPLEVELDDTGTNFETLVCSALKLDTASFRMIANGNIIEAGRSLKHQNVCHGNDILVILLSPEEIEANRENTWMQSIEKTKEAAARLTGKAAGVSERYLEITDQNGTPINLPLAEQTSLSTAMALHERGKTSIKLKQYGRALLFLLEADNYFHNVSKQVLDLVDNSAIMNLDIVWCYLMLHKLNSLPDCRTRLQKSEEAFKKSYGHNFERLAWIKKGEGLEMCLIVRVELLKGVLAFHDRNPVQARQCFGIAEQGIQKMRVDDAKLALLLDMGYKTDESRLALRASENNMQQAVSKIIEKREEKRLKKEETKKEAQKRAMARGLNEVLGNLGVQNNTITSQTSNEQMHNQSAFLQTAIDAALAANLIAEQMQEASPNPNASRLIPSAEDLADEQALNELTQEVNADPNHHLDATFDDELLILSQYRAMILDL